MKKEKTKLKLWEKIFIITNIVIILLIISIYAYRTVRYYKKLNYVESNPNLLEKITSNITYKGDGLYKKDDDNFYYSGKEVNNYLYYSGRLWRIIGIDKTGIKLITEDNQTVLVWGNNTNFENSIINNWLNKDVFINTISNKEKLVSASWCNTGVDINNYNCNNTKEYLVGLITTEEYLKAGGINSYLNNNSYYWTLNTSNDNKVYYIHSGGGINNDLGNNESLYSYGVRPVIYLNSNVEFLSGDGTKENPYIIEENNNVKLNEHNIGEYVKYSNYTFRILEKNDNYIKLMMDELILDDDESKLKISYDNIEKYLNNEFINKLDKESLVKTNFNLTEYNFDNNYNYNDNKETKEMYIGLPIIGQLFITDYKDIWLNTIQDKTKQLIYKIDNDSIIGDLKSSKNYLRPIIAVKSDLIISSGSGIKEDPYILSNN